MPHRAALSIENARLYRAANRAVQVRDDVLGIVAHDLRNPLNSIVLQAALLRRRGAEPGSRLREPVEAIAHAANRMNRLIQDLLDVTRIEAGRLSLQRDRVHTLQTVADAIEEALRVEHHRRPAHVEGYGRAEWVLLDYFDFVVHVFTPEMRTFYGLERLWGSAASVDLHGILAAPKR